jgi:hypothetical protein
LTIVSFIQWDREIYRLPLIIGEKWEFHVDNETIVELFSQLP